MGLKIGDKVRNIHDNTEGKFVYSAFGASITGWVVDEEGNRVHFQTLGKSVHEYEADWKRVYKYRYNIKNIIDEAVLVMHGKYTDDVPPHKKRSKKKSPKKSDHKHEYELVKKREWAIKGWFTHVEACKICGKERNKLVID